MVRVVVDTQSSSLFRGRSIEQSYGKRGALCEGGRGDIAIVPERFDPVYLSYWGSLGFQLPEIVVVRRNDQAQSQVLSELLAADKGANRRILQIIGNQPARLEFFCITQSEVDLLSRLPLPAYCNTEFSIAFESKTAFRALSARLGLPQCASAACTDDRGLHSFAHGLFAQGKQMIVKADRGTGGVACGGAFGPIGTNTALREVLRNLRIGGDSPVVAEEFLEDAVELSVSWEITERGKIVGPRIARQLANHGSYGGAAWPPGIPDRCLDRIAGRVHGQLGPAIRDLGGVGFFCCDVIAHPSEHWMDFNPRKGAVKYVLDAVERLCGRLTPFYHRHVRLAEPTRFSDVQRALGALLRPSRDPFVFITNPGVLQHGFVDITGVAPTVEDAELAFRHAVAVLNRSLRTRSEPSSACGFASQEL